MTVRKPPCPGPHFANPRAIRPRGVLVVSAIAGPVSNRQHGLRHATTAATSHDDGHSRFTALVKEALQTASPSKPPDAIVARKAASTAPKSTSSVFQTASLSRSAIAVARPERAARSDGQAVCKSPPPKLSAQKAAAPSAPQPTPMSNAPVTPTPVASADQHVVVITGAGDAADHAGTPDQSCVAEPLTVASADHRAAATARSDKDAAIVRGTGKQSVPPVVDDATASASTSPVGDRPPPASSGQTEPLASLLSVHRATAEQTGPNSSDPAPASTPTTGRSPDGNLGLAQAGTTRVSAAESLPGDLSVRLSLPHLGTVEVRVGKSDADGPTMTISSDRRETLHAMANDEAQLRSALADSGLDQPARAIEYNLIPTSTDLSDRPSFSSQSDHSRQGGHDDAPSQANAGQNENVLSSSPAIVGAPRSTLGVIDISA